MRKLICPVFSVAAVVFVASVASAQLGLSAGAHAGYASYSAGGSSNGGLDFGANANISVPMVLSVQVFADYFSYSKSTEGVTTVETKSTDIPIGVHMVYGLSIPGSPIKPYLGVGPSIHLLKWEVTQSGTTSEDSSTKFGIGGVGGVELKFMPKMGLFMELRDHIIFTENENTNGLYVLGGVNFKLI